MSLIEQLGWAVAEPKQPRVPPPPPADHEDRKVWVVAAYLDAYSSKIERGEKKKGNIDIDKFLAHLYVEYGTEKRHAWEIIGHINQKTLRYFFHPDSLRKHGLWRDG